MPSFTRGSGMADSTYRTGPLCFRYGDASPCLDMNDFPIKRGAITVLAGENGSGKTTLLKILGGLLEPDGDSRKREELSGVRQDALYLHQSPYLFQGTVERNLIMARRDSDETRRHEALAAVGLEGFGNRKVRSLSGGESRRTALARAFLTDRPLLLLDEPAAHADAGSVRLIEEACRRFAEAGRTVVVATHRGSFAYRIADHLYDLSGGKARIGAANILQGTVAEKKEGFIHFAAGSAIIKAPLRDGDFQVAVVPGEDILLSRRPLESSARNCLPGILQSVERREDGSVFARVDCGTVLTSRITDSSVKELALVPGAAVHATFKASAVRLY